MREILKTANGRFYTPDEFNTALRNLNLAPQLSCTHLNIPSLPYHYLEQHNLLYNLEVKNISSIFKQSQYFYEGNPKNGKW